MPPFDLRGLTPLDTAGLTEFDDSTPPSLDVSGLKPLDTTGLTEVAADDAAATAEPDLPPAVGGVGRRYAAMTGPVGPAPSSAPPAAATLDPLDAATARHYETTTRFGRVGAQLESGFELLKQSGLGTGLQLTARALAQMDSIDSGAAPARPDDDILGYAEMTPEQRAEARSSAERDFGDGIARIVESRSRQAELPRHPGAQALVDRVNQGDYAGAWRAFTSDPVGITQQFSVESLPLSAPMMVGGMAAATAGKVPAALAAFGGSYATEFGPKFLDNVVEGLTARGVDVNDEAAVTAALRADPGIITEARRKAGRGAAGPATFDALTLGTGRAIRPGAGVLRNTGAVVRNTAAELASEPAGEAAAQILEEGAVTKPGELVAETLGAGPQVIGTTAAATVAEMRQVARSPHVDPRLVAEEMANLSQADRASPIPDELIAEGRAIIRQGGPLPAAPATGGAESVAEFGHREAEPGQISPADATTSQQAPIAAAPRVEAFIIDNPAGGQGPETVEYVANPDGSAEIRHGDQTIDVSDLARAELNPAEIIATVLGDHPRGTAPRFDLVRPGRDVAPPAAPAVRGAPAQPIDTAGLKPVDEEFERQIEDTLALARAAGKPAAQQARLRTDLAALDTARLPAKRRARLAEVYGEALRRLEEQDRRRAISRSQAARKAIETRKANLGRPLNVFEFIAANGGIDPGDPQIGDLHAVLGRKQQIVPLFGAVIRRGGMSLDRAREMLEEARYIGRGGRGGATYAEATTTQDVLDAIDRQARGTPVYSLTDVGEAQEVESADRSAEEREREAEALRAVETMAAERGVTLTDGEARDAAALIRQGVPEEEALETVVEQGALAYEDRLAQIGQEKGDGDEFAIPYEPAGERRADEEVAAPGRPAEEPDAGAALGGPPARPEPRGGEPAEEEPRTEVAPPREPGAGSSSDTPQRLDPNRKYEPAAEGQPVTKTAPVDGDVVDWTIGADDFREITDEWAALFAEPEEQVRVAKKAGPYIDTAKADEIIAGWKARAAELRQKYGGENFDKTVLSLFDLTGEWSKPWEEAGYNVIRFDIQTGQDVREFSVEYFTENWDFGEVYAILAACPCTEFAVSGARHFAAKDADGRTEAAKELVFQTMRTIEYFRPAIWALENPVGRIENLTGLPPWRLSFEPHHFGNPYTKKTLIWGNFNADLPTANVDPVEGSKMWAKYGGKSQRTKNARSATPEGFAYAFFMANNYHDMPVEMRLTARYPEASGAVRAALKAGVTEDRINELMRDTYGNYEYEDARNALVKEVASLKGSRRPTSAAGATAPAAGQKAGDIRGGELGMQLAAGEIVRTVSGRKTTPFPKVDTSTGGKARLSAKRVDRWLLQNALDEARARDDDHNARMFEANLEKPSPADKDSAERYLFGDDLTDDERVQVEADRIEALAEQFDFETAYPPPIAARIEALDREGREHPLTESADEEAIRAVTEEQLNELHGYLIEIETAEDALAAGVRPGKKKPLDGDDRKSIEAAIARAKQAYDDTLAAYEELFGEDAVALLDREARRRHTEGTLERRRAPEAEPREETPAPTAEQPAMPAAPEFTLEAQDATKSKKKAGPEQLSLTGTTRVETRPDRMTAKRRGTDGDGPAGDLFDTGARQQTDLVDAARAPAPAEFDPATAVKIVADDVASIRPQDLDRLFAETDPRNYDDLRAYILERRPELGAAVLDAIEANGGAQRDDGPGVDLTALYADQAAKGERIKAALAAGAQIVVPRPGAGNLVLTTPDQIKVGKTGVYVRRGRNWDKLPFTAVDVMAQQAARAEPAEQPGGASRGRQKDSIVFGRGAYYVLRVPTGFEVYKQGATAAERVARIGHKGDDGLQRAKAEIERRIGEAGKGERAAPKSDYGTKNKVFTQDAAERARELLRRKLGGGQLNTGIDPEVVQAGITLAGYHIEAGARKFADFTRAMIEDLGDAVRPYLRSWYEAARHYPGFDAAGMSDAREIEDALRRGEDLERDRGQPEPADAVRAAGLPDAGRGDGAGARGEGRRAPPERAAEPGGRGVSRRDAAAPRAGGDLDLFGVEPAALRGATDSRGRRGGGDPGSEGLPAERTPEASVERAAPGSPDLKDPAARRAAQAAADRRPVRLADADSIAETLPLLLPAQQQDVLKAERRFEKLDAFGFLFTNATGTGKTYTGAGVIKRLVRQGRSNILVLAPSQDIAQGWVEALKDLGVEARILDSTTDNGGSGVVATTYANAGENRTLADRDWDLVVPDEAHNLSQNGAGDPTAALETVRAITNHPRGLHAKARMRLRKQWERADRMRDERGKEPASVEEEKLVSALWEKTQELAKQLGREPRGRVLFLSATPFAYDKNIDYAEGYLFDYPKDDHRGGYNVAKGREAFFVQHFGYRMRTNKLTTPDANVDSGVMEREFHEWLKREGALSGRRLEVDADYDRKFVLVDDAVGTRIDQALSFLHGEGGRFTRLADYIRKRFDYLKRQQLLEAIKAHHAVPIIREHLALGRKIVVFHDFNVGGGFNPFAEPETGDHAVKDLYREFVARNPGIDRLDFSRMGSPIQTIRAAFPDALFYNGTETPKARREAKALFNRDGSGRDIIVVQAMAGQAGISLHDVTGKHQRVLLNLGMPTRPTAALQEEGRIYRTGQVSDAVIRYMNTGTNWERWTFAQKIAERASTAENLALGNEARMIRQAFIEAFEASDTYPPAAGEGRGGKAADASTRADVSDFERAKTFYFGQQKNTKRRDRREGIDYFATPEPLGFKMVEWAGLRPGEKALEPSAGHGAIARFLPEIAARTLIEPSQELASRAALASPGAKVIPERFEDHNIVNKYDAVVMNPPFGSGGKTAIEHVARAAKHLRNGGRIVALIPEGASADRRFEAFMDSDDAKGLYLVADIKLPAVTFERAGTAVRARVAVLEKQTESADSAKLQQVSRDYSDAGTIAEFFDAIANAEIPPRVRPTVEEAEIYDSGIVTLDGTELDLDYSPSIAVVANKVGKGRFAELARAAERHQGWYRRNLRGFQFPDKEQRQKFLEAVARGDLGGTTPAAAPASPETLTGATAHRFETAETTHGKTGDKLFVATMADRVGRETYDAINIPGFQFKSEEARKAFVDEAGRVDVDGAADRLAMPRDDDAFPALRQRAGVMDRLFRRGEPAAPDQKVGISADLARIIKIMGPRLYSRDMPDVTMKELLQNAFDGVKASYAKGDLPAGQGRIEIEYDRRNRTLTLRDNGAGMTAATVREAFLTVAGTNKDGLSTQEASGGFGIAKLAFIFGNDGLKLRTVRDGIATELDSTGDELMAGNADLRQSRSGDANGTEVTVTFPKTYKDAGGESKELNLPFGASFDILKRPLIGDVRVTFTEIDGKRRNDLSVRDRMTVAAPKITTAETSWGDIEVYLGEKREGSNWSAEHDVLSAGLWQFSTAITESSGFGSQKIPYRIILNVKPKVGADSEFYPFNNQREAWSNKIGPDIEALNHYLRLVNWSRDAIDTGGSFAGVQRMVAAGDGAEFRPSGIREAMPSAKAVSVARTETIQIRNGNLTVDGQEIKRGENPNKRENFRVPDAAVPTAEPLFHSNLNVDIVAAAAGRSGIAEGRLREFLRRIGDAAMLFRDGLGRIPGNEYKAYSADDPAARPVGVSLDKSYGGVHIEVPYKGFFVNPFYGPYVGGLPAPRAKAASVLHVLFHEAVHEKVGKHNEDFTSALGNLYGLFEQHSPGLEDRIKAALADAYTELRAEHDALKEVYDDAATKNVEAGTGTPARSAGDARAAGDAYRDAGGAQGGAGDRRRGAGDGSQTARRGRPGGTAEVDRFAREKPFFSALTRAVEQASTTRAPVPQWRAFIQNLRSRGVKEEEIGWSGVLEWLADKQGPVTRDEITAFLRENEVKVEEVVKEGPPIRDDDNESDYTFDELSQEEGGGFAILYRHEPVAGEPVYASRDEANDRINQIIRERGHTKYADYTMPGGENYRELLLTLPPKTSPEGNAVAAFARSMRKRYGERWISEATPEEKKRYDELIADQESLPRQPEAENFRSGHFDEPNVLAHIRFNERTDADGKRVLFIEEIQSDWMQKGRKLGFRGKLPKDQLPPGTEIYQYENTVGRFYQAVFMPASGRAGAAGQPGQTREEAIRNAVDEYERAAVPDAPFKSSWHELAFKRALRWAAENGFDRIAWTTGEIQTDRYDLSKHIRRIELEDYAAGRFELRAYKYNDNINPPVIRQAGITREEVADFIGKEAAERLFSDDNNARAAAGLGRKLEGLDLKVGGEGMRVFYDKILPAFASKYAKKWGARAGTTRIEFSLGAPKTFSVDRDPDTGEWILRGGGGALVPGEAFDTEREAAEVAASWNRDEDAGEGMQTVHSLDITEAMRDSVMQGQPLFARAGPSRLADDQDAFNRQLDEYLKDPKAWGAQKPLVLGETPAVLEFAGLNRRPLQIVPDVIEKVMERHAVSKETLRRLLIDLSEPIYVMHADPALNPGNISALLSSTDQFGENLLVGINPRTGKVDIARVATVHGRERIPSGKEGVSLERFLQRNAEEGKIVYVDRDAAAEWSARRGIETPTWPTIRDRNPKVQTKANLVKLQERQDRYREDAGSPPQPAITVEEVRRALRAELDRIGLDDIGLDLVDAIPDRAGRPTRNRGRYRPGRKLIEVALRGDVRATLDHEAIHALRDLGLFRKSEWGVLLRAALADSDRMADIRQRYDGLDRDAMIEEAIADMYADWQLGRMEVRGFVRTAFERIRRYFEAVGNALRGLGFTTAEDVFRAIDAGTIGRRDPMQLAEEIPNLATIAARLQAELGADRLSAAEFRDARRPGTAERTAGRVELYDAKGIVLTIPTNRPIEEAAPIAEKYARAGNVQWRYVDNGTGETLRDSAVAEAQSRGRPQTDTPEFKRWFGDSKIVDDNGDPLVVYHGTPAVNGIHRFRQPAYFTNEPSFAEIFASERGDTQGATYPVYLKIEKPYVIDGRHEGRHFEWDAEDIARMKSEGYDGVIVKGGPDESDIYTTFDARQIKSVFNRGSFDPGDPRVSYNYPSEVAANTEADRLERETGYGYYRMRTTYLDGSVVWTIGTSLVPLEAVGEQPSAEAVAYRKRLPEEFRRAIEARIREIGGTSPAAVERESGAPQQGALFDKYSVPRTTPPPAAAPLTAITRGQHLDKVFRMPFSPFGGLTDRGEWRPGLKLSEKAGKIITAAEFSPEGRFAFINPILKTARAGLVDRYGLPDDYVSRERQRGLDERAVMVQGAEIMQTLRDHAVGPDEARVLQAMLTGEAVSAGEIGALAEPIRRAIDDLGQEAVNLGLVSPESYERNRGTYLHRVYLRHETEADAMARWASQFSARRRKKLIGDELKGRGMTLEVPVDALSRQGLAFPQGEQGRPKVKDSYRVLDRLAENIDAEDPARPRILERVYLRADRDIPTHYQGWKDHGTWEIRTFKGDRAVLWRDFTKAERDAMGEILDARYTIAKTFMLMAHDLANGRFYKDIAQNAEWARKDIPGERWADAGEYYRVNPVGFPVVRDQEIAWVKVPDVDIPNSGGKKKWGALAGLYVRAEIWRDLNELDQLNRPNFWNRLLTQWKLNKALALDTPIPTPTGWTTMGAIKVGEQVFDERGEVCEVTEVKEIAHSRPCYEVAFSDGAKIVADAEHLWFTVMRNKGGGVRTTLEILDTLKERTRGDHNHSVPVAGALHLPEAALPLSPYALGLWLGDGHGASPRITVGGAVADEVQTHLAADGIYCGRKRRDKRSSAVTFTIDTQHVVAAGNRTNRFKAGLSALGTLGTKRIPAIYLRASMSQRRALLQGLMDADGWITARGTCGFCTSLPYLRDGVLDLLRSLGFKPTVTDLVPDCNGKPGKRTWRIHFQAYADTPVFRLSQKLRRLRPAPATNQRSRTRQIVSIKPVDSVPVRCIAVSSPSRLYLAGRGMIPTHNTARSPVVHMNNVMSNLMFMDMADIRLRDLVAGVKAYASGNTDYEDAVAHGALGADQLSQEMRRDILEPILEEIGGQARGNAQGGLMNRIGTLGKIMSALWERAKTADRKMRDLYKAEDDIFRMAAYMRRKALGDSPKDAADFARQQFLDYDIRAPWVNWARRTVLPFIAYTYRAVPVIAHSIAARPWKLAKYFAVAYALNTLAYMIAPGDEDEERRLMREQERGYTWLGVPRMLRMPWRDDYGNPVFLDIRRWIPAGDIFDISQGSSAIGIPAWLQFGGPAMLAFEFFLNKKAFDGKPIVNDKTDTPWERVTNTADWLFKSWMPSAPWVPNSWYSTRIGDALQGVRDPAGNPQSLPQALSSSVGVKVKSHDLQTARKFRAIEFENEERALDAERSKLRRDRLSGRLSKSAYDDAMAGLNRKMERLAKRRREALAR